MLVGPGSFFVVACRVPSGEVIGALLLCCREYAAFVGLLGSFLCLLAGDGWRSDLVGRAVWGGCFGMCVVGIAVCAWGLGGLARSAMRGCFSFLRKVGAVLASGGEGLGSGGRFELAAWSCVGVFRGGVLVISAYVAGVVLGSVLGVVGGFVSAEGGPFSVFGLSFWWSGVWLRGSG
jgi:hypothetical protein